MQPGLVSFSFAIAVIDVLARNGHISAAEKYMTTHIPHSEVVRLLIGQCGCADATFVSAVTTLQTEKCRDWTPCNEREQFSAN